MREHCLCHMTVLISSKSTNLSSSWHHQNVWNPDQWILQKVFKLIHCTVHCKRSRGFVNHLVTKSHLHPTMSLSTWTTWQNEPYAIQKRCSWYCGCNVDIQQSRLPCTSVVHNYYICHLQTSEATTWKVQ